jgi:hypothetical protein
MTNLTTVEYSTNNSGGDWWLTDDDWRNLEKAGWEVDWREERWLGALATRASKHNTTLREAIAEWETITGQYSNELGCGCCGAPHYFSAENGESYSPEFPTFGDRY